MGRNSSVEYIIPTFPTPPPLFAISPSIPNWRVHTIEIFDFRDLP